MKTQVRDTSLDQDAAQTQVQAVLPERGPLPKRAGLWRRWMYVTGFGQCVGFMFPALAALILSNTASGLDPTTVPLVTLVAYFIAAALEGTALGAAQSIVLREAVPAASRRRWIVATALGSLATWVVCMLPDILTNMSALGLGTLLLLLIVTALAVPVIIGAAQWFVLRQYVARAWLWIPASACGRAFGLGVTLVAIQAVSEYERVWLPANIFSLNIIFFGGLLIDQTTTILMAVIAGLVGSIAMGLVTGALTGWLLVWLLRRNAADRATQQP